ncbi:MAG: sigma-54-dependent Fis family transcriptional regulator [Campylobacterales bacterium]|nr:sigma-54-dependent Fis family transcriptional regulator [Campylobacterales bacterium]
MKIAIVEDDINMRKSLEIALGEYKEFKIVSFKSPKDALKSLDDTVDLVITDITMPGMDGIEFLRQLNGRYEAIVITGNATLNKAIEALRLGAKDFLTKPFEVDTLVEAIKRSEQVQKVVKSKNIENSEITNSGFIGSSEALDRCLKIAKKSAQTDVSVMLLGESGVGKELFAKYIHENSNRKNKPFVAINMAAIPDNLLESELFGFEKGSFTDAIESKDGKFEVANGGTIFLDEIGEMPMNLQAKLLRVLQEKEVTKLGSNKPISLDVRVVSATNANIEDKILKGEFREDLYFRLNTIPINIPPLRERKDEILPIAEHVLKQSIQKYGFSEKYFSNEAKELLLSCAWHGNIRELISVVERAVILSDENEISKDDLFLESRGQKSKKSFNNLEKDLILEALVQTNYNMKDSSELLGMNEHILEKKIKKYGL